MKHLRSSFFLIPVIILPIIFALGLIDQNQPIEKENNAPSTINNEPLMMSVLWHQTAAEYRALCYQAYNIAELRLQQALKEKHSKPLAIIVDVDETILDNSPYNAGNIEHKLSYPDDFYRWINAAQCAAVPGSVEFLQSAQRQDVKVFYITNRRERGSEGTIKNLQKLGFPEVDDNSVLLKTKESSKKNRREQVANTHEIIMMIGDNLLDFSDFFKDENFPQRKMAVDEQKNSFGERFIILPNAMHGEWIKMIYKRESGLPENEKLLKRIELLNSFE